MEKYINYARHIGADDYVIKWCERVLDKHITSNPISTEEVEHILDYLAQANKKLERMSYEQAKDLAEKWTKSLQKKGSEIKETKEDTEVVLDFKDGFKIVKLIGENAYKREGFLMRHCSASYFGKDVEVYSLRDKKNNPHCTIEKDQQVKGKGNGDINPKYVGYVVKFLEHIGMTVGDSEMKHLGYVNVEDVMKKEKDLVFPESYNKKYFYKEKISEVENRDRMSLWGLFDLFTFNSKLEVKFNFDFSKSADFLRDKLSKLKNMTSSNEVAMTNNNEVAMTNYNRVAMNGSNKVAMADFNEVAMTDNNEVAMTNYNRVAMTSSNKVAMTNYNRVAMTKYNRVAMTSDNEVAMTNYNRVAMTSSNEVAMNGYNKVAMTNYNRVAMTSDNEVAMNGSNKVAMADFNEVAMNGYNEVAMTNYNRVAMTDNNEVAMTNYNRVAMTDSNEVAMADFNEVAMNDYNKIKAGNMCSLVGGDENEISIGKKSIAVMSNGSKVKGDIGSVIVLYERDKDYNIISVKSAIIDGKKIKEDVWYKLENKKFVEVK